KRLRLRALMDACMTQFSAVKDRWKIVWGPADFSATSPGLDDVLMYIAQRVDSPSTVAITIRGTNPMSPHDWVFGDLMVTHQVPWAYGAPEATKNCMISASTAFGLRILQQLRWEDTVSAGATAATVTAGGIDSR